MGRLDALAETQYGQRKRLVDTAAAHCVVRWQQVPPRMRGTPACNLRVIMVLMEMRDDEINLLPLSVVQKKFQFALGVAPIIEDDKAILLFGHKTAVSDIV